MKYLPIWEIPGAGVYNPKALSKQKLCLSFRFFFFFRKEIWYFKCWPWWPLWVPSNFEYSVILWSCSCDGKPKQKKPLDSVHFINYCIRQINEKYVLTRNIHIPSSTKVSLSIKLLLYSLLSITQTFSVITEHAIYHSKNCNQDLQIMSLKLSTSTLNNQLVFN